MARLGAIDLGATNLRAAVAPGPDDPLITVVRDTPTATTGTTVAKAAAETLEEAAERAGLDAMALDAIGVGSIGPLDRGAGAVVEPPNLPGVDRIPLQDVLIALVGHPRVYIENDAVAGLVGERAAVEDPPANQIYLTLSTGIGAGVAVDGRVLRGRAGNAAEVGHLVVEPDGRLCGCGAQGHWEAYCSGSAIPAVTRELADETDLDTELAIGNHGLPAAAVFEAVGGDPLADRVVSMVSQYNAIGVADLVHAYAPDRIAIGGAVAIENPELVVDPLQAAVDEHTMLAVPEIAATVHGHEAVLRGALSLARAGGIEGD